MDKINRRQSTTFDSANLEAALNSIQETSGKEEVEDTGMTQDVLSICVQFPTGYLTGTYDGEQILLNTGYKRNAKL